MCLKYFISTGLILYCLIQLNTGFAQKSEYDFRTLDKTTYRFFMNKNWDSLVQTGEMALNNNYDYFYLRFRLGVACFETRNYCKAVHHFKKALKFNHDDTNVKEYLYYSYVYLNRTHEANLLSTDFSLKLQSSILNGSFKFFDHFYLESGSSISNNIENNRKLKLAGSSDLFGYQDLNDNKFYFHLGTGINFSKRVSAYLGYNFLSISKLKQIQINNPLNSASNSNYDYDYKLFQHQIYANLNIVFNNGINLTPAIHLLNMSTGTLKIVPDQQINKPLVSVESDTVFTNFVTSLALNKYISIFNFGLHSSYSNLNDKTQFQLGGSFTLFPTGNINIYLTSTLTSAWEEDKNRIIFDQLVGFKFFNKLWMEGFITLGDMVNFNEKNAYVVHNSMDIIKLRRGVNFIMPVSDKVELSFRYMYLTVEGYWDRMSVNNDLNTTIFNYHNNTIIGGIKWKL